VHLGISPLRTGDPVEEVSITLLLPDSAGAKMLKLEEVICGQLEVEGRALVEAVAMYVLTCFQSWVPQISPEPVAQGSITKTEEAARADFQDTMKLLVVLFNSEPVDT
jgi:hypothetical protein